MVFVLEMAVQLDYVGVVEAIVNLELSRELLFHFVVLDGRLEYFLDGADESCLLVDAQVDISEFARADAFSKLKIADLHGWRGGLWLELLEDIERWAGLLDIKRMAVVRFVGDVGLMFLQGQGVGVKNEARSE